MVGVSRLCKGYRTYASYQAWLVKRSWCLSAHFHNLVIFSPCFLSFINHETLKTSHWSPILFYHFWFLKFLFAAAGVKDTVFASHVPNNSNKLIEELIEEIMGDHERLVCPCTLSLCFILPHASPSNQCNITRSIPKPLFDVLVVPIFCRQKAVNVLKLKE